MWVNIYNTWVKAMVELFFHLASKWPKWCAQTFAPIFQILKIFAGICAPIVPPPSENFQICHLHCNLHFFLLLLVLSSSSSSLTDVGSSSSSHPLQL